MLAHLRYAFRQFRQAPVLAVTILLTLALGIGANTAIFSIDYATLLAPLPYPKPEQLVVAWSKVQGFHNQISAGDFTDWRRMNTSLQSLHAFSPGVFNLAGRDEPENINGTQITAGFYAMLGQRFFLGRDFLADEGSAGRDHVVILAHKLWLHLGGDRGIIGRTLRIDGQPYTVVGVLAPGVADRNPAQLAVPLVFKPEQVNHDFHWLLTIGRLKPGVTIRQAQANMDAVAAEVARENPRSNKGWGAFVEPLQNDFLPSERKQTLWLLLGAVGFVLLIACVNVANLLLARGMARQKEAAIRSALGASRAAIFGQLLAESLLLALAGGLLGIGVGYGLLRAIVALVPEGTLPSEADPSLSLPALGFALAAATLAGVLFGSAPAWYASRVDPAESLKEGGSTGFSTARRRVRQGLVVGEFALALSLLTGAGLAIHSFLNLLRVDLGIQTDHVLTFFLPVPDTRPKDPEKIIGYYRQILARLAQVPGVQSSSVQTGLPLLGPGFGMPFSIVGKPAMTDPSLRVFTRFGMVTPGYLKTFGIRLVRGRAFTEQDDAASVKVAVVNEEFAAQYLKGVDPLTQRVSVEQLIPGVTRLGPPIEWQIVGVYHSVRNGDVRENRPEMEVPFSQSPWPTAAIAVRTSTEPKAMFKSISAAVHSVDPAIALADPRSMDEVHNLVLANDQFNLLLFAAFAIIALLLAGLGIYGVMSFSVAQRSREIALRLALGSTRERIVGLVVREGVQMALVGLGLGLVGAYLVGRGMAAILFGVGKLDLPVLCCVALVLVGAAMLACMLPARRASLQDPAQMLRRE